MQDTYYQYVLAELPDTERLKNWLALEQGRLVGQQPAGCRRTYLDTFDWRLYNKNLVLELDQTKPVDQLRLRDRGRECEAISQPIDSMPRFPADLPDGRLRTRLMKLCKMRALLPVITTYYEFTPLDIQDRGGKSVARLHLGRFHRHDGSRNNVQHEQLSFEPLRGYAAEAEPLREQLESRLPLADEQPDPFEALCRKHDIHPGLYQTKLKLPLSADERADQALGRLLQYLLSIMELNEEGIREDLDTEFLHDFRIACRRSRTLINQVRDVLPAEQKEHARTVFAWLSEITGPYRDMDVFLLDLERLIADAGLQADAGALADLRHVLEAERRTARARLLRGLRSKRYERFKNDWRNVLETAARGGLDAPASGESAKTVADRNIWRVYKKILKDGTRVDPFVDTVALHELRKRAKKLRYLLEAFQTLYPADEMQEAIGILKKLQDNMGEIVDAAVQSETLQHIRNDLRVGFENRHTSALVQALIDYCDQRHDALLAEFTKEFKNFSKKKNRKRYQALFKPGNKPAG